MHGQTTDKQRTNNGLERTAANGQKNTQLFSWRALSFVRPFLVRASPFSSVRPLGPLLCFAFCILTLFLCGCAQKDRWQETSIKTGASKYDSSRLSYIAEDRVNGIDLEMIQTLEDLKIYLVVHSSPVSPYEEDAKKSLVKISTEKKKRVILAIRREGGQRLLLPESIYPFILDALKEGESVTLQLPGYETKISPGKFKERFEKLEHPSPFDVRINLPL